MRRWLRDDECSRAIRNESLLRGFLLWLLPPEDARAHFETEIAHYRAEVGRYDAIVELPVEWSATATARMQRVMLESGIRVSRALVEWAEWARSELEDDR